MEKMITVSQLHFGLDARGQGELFHKTKKFYKLLSPVAIFLKKREGLTDRAKGTFVHGDINKRSSQRCSRL